MKLSDEENKQFFKLYIRLQIYTAGNMKKYSHIRTEEDYKALALEDMKEIRDYLFDHTELIDSFVEENPAGFSEEELEIIRRWKHSVKGKFFVLKYLKKYTVFLSGEEEGPAYGVVGLSDEPENIFGPYLPILVDAVLMPFMGKIVYDGLFGSYNVVWGSTIRRHLEANYQREKALHGIVTTLPYEFPEKEESPEELLRFYMKSNKNFESYSQEIFELVNEHPELEGLFYREAGRLSSKQIKRTLKDMGVKNAWYGIMESTIVAGARTEDELMEILREILPPEKLERVYTFRIK